MNRRYLVKAFFNAFLIITLLFTAQWSYTKSTEKKQIMVTRPFFSMGTRAEIKICTNDVKNAEVAMDAAINRINYLANTLTKFSRTSDVGRLNAYPNKPLYASLDTIYVLRQGLDMSAKTNYKFDMGMGNFLSKLKPDAVVHTVGNQPFAKHNVSKHPIVSIDDRMVKLNRRNSMLDLGGIAKGYALEEGMTILMKHGIKHAAIDIGGDLIVRGGKSSSQPWVIGIAADLKNKKDLISLFNGAVTSSGNAEKPNHIIDPETLRPSARYQQMVVIGPNATICDALATAAYNTNASKLKSLEKKFARYKLLAVHKLRLEG